MRRVARAGGRARRRRRAALAPARGRAGPGGVQSAREASVLSLGGVSRALFALGHADPVWWQLVERDFPDVEAVARPLRGRVAGDPYGGGARRARGGGRLARALGRALLHLRRVVVATSYRDDAMALGWRMPQRAPTPDLQTPGRSATHTFEPRLGQAAALRAESELSSTTEIWSGAADVRRARGSAECRGDHRRPPRGLDAHER